MEDWGITKRWRLLHSLFPFSPQVGHPHFSEAAQFARFDRNHCSAASHKHCMLEHAEANSCLDLNRTTTAVGGRARDGEARTDT